MRGKPYVISLDDNMIFVKDGNYPFFFQIVTKTLYGDQSLRKHMQSYEEIIYKFTILGRLRKTH